MTQESQDLEVGDDKPGEQIKFQHVQAPYWKARASAILGLQIILGLTLLVGFIGIVVLSLNGKTTDVVREIIQTAVAAEVAILASSLARPES